MEGVTVRDEDASGTESRRPPGRYEGVMVSCEQDQLRGCTSCKGLQLLHDLPGGFLETGLMEFGEVAVDDEPIARFHQGAQRLGGIDQFVARHVGCPR